jgi:hydrogenase expression/formation protein HypC
MCLGIPGEVIELLDRPDLAKVNVSGVRRAINIGLLENENVQPGDWILIHVGFALSKMRWRSRTSSRPMLPQRGRRGSPATSLEVSSFALCR